MSGYVASARIDRRSARFAHAWEAAEPRSAPRAADDRTPPANVAWIEAPPDQLRPGRLTARWTAFRERWSQLTFFLFDPNSWR